MGAHSGELPQSAEGPMTFLKLRYPPVSQSPVSPPGNISARGQDHLSPFWQEFGRGSGESIHNMFTR